MPVAGTRGIVLRARRDGLIHAALPVLEDLWSKAWTSRATSHSTDRSTSKQAVCVPLARDAKMLAAGMRNSARAGQRVHHVRP